MKASSASSSGAIGELKSAMLKLTVCTTHPVSHKFQHCSTGIRTHNLLIIIRSLEKDILLATGILGRPEVVLVEEGLDVGVGVGAGFVVLRFDVDLALQLGRELLACIVEPRRCGAEQSF